MSGTCARHVTAGRGRGAPRIRAGVIALAAAMAVAAAPQPASAQEEPRFDALVFSKTTGFRHTEGIDAGKVAIRELAAAHNFRVDETEDSSQFTEQNLAKYDVVVMLHPDGNNVLLDDQEIAFERYMQRGGGVVGIHAAANMNRDWPWWQDLLGGGLFANHPPIQSATLRVEDPTHPATAHLPATFEWTDEWYNFTADPRDENVHVLLSVDESTYTGGTHGEGHPIAWCSNYDGGRAFYTAIGHSGFHYSDPLYRGHIRGAIEWAAGVTGAPATAKDKQPVCGPAREGIPSDSSFDKVTLDAGTENPMELAVAPNLDVYYVELGGAVKVWNPDAQQTRVIGTIPVHRGNENGLLGLALDPSFASNRHLYVFYSAPPQEGPTGVQHVSRFTLKANGDLDMASERVLLRIPHQRLICCHSAGSLAFGPDRQLYISTGDDTTPFETSSFAPIDDDVLRNNVPGDPENDANKAYDARRTSGNTNDLRGKILRIVPKPNPTGPPGPGRTYDIPAGNLFPPFASDPARTRPEIYTMGHRNPFRIAVDPETGWLYNGEVGPDANNDNANRGPRGYDELNQIRSAGNMGWPYCIAADWRTPSPLDSFAYRDFTYPSGPSGDAFDCSGTPGGGPVNTSRYNTGLTQTPPAKPAAVYWPYTPYPSGFPWSSVPTGSGRTAIAGPTYHYNRVRSRGANTLPRYFDDKVFFGDWSRNWLATLTLDAGGNALKVDRFMGNTRFRAPQDMEIGPDGALYLLEWGDSFNFGGAGVNRDSGLYRIDYAKGSRTPIVSVSADRDSGPAPLTVQFSSEGTRDPDGDPITLEWSFGDGTGSTESNPTHTYTAVGTYTAQLRVTDSAGKVGTGAVTIHVGNTRPTVRIEIPDDGGFFDWGDTIPYRVEVTDPEDADIACGRVTVSMGLLHDSGGAGHVHPGVEQTGCEGTLQTQPDPGHAEGTLLMQVVTATYTDTGGQPGSQPLQGGVTHRLWPKTVQAENYTDQSGLTITDNTTARGAFRLQSVTVGDWLYYEPMSLVNIDQVSVRYSSGSTAGGVIHMRTGSPDGPIVATLEAPPTGGGNTYATVAAPVTPTAGTHRVYFTFAQRAGGPTNNLFNLDEFTFIGQGAAGT
jgi:cytochrome c